MLATKVSHSRLRDSGVWEQNEASPARTAAWPSRMDPPIVTARAGPGPAFAISAGIVTAGLTPMRWTG